MNYKFRGKRVDNGAWVYGYYFKTPLTAENFEADYFQSGINRYCISNEHGVVYEVHKETVGMWTGLTDLIDTEIYKDDIFQFPSGAIAVITWHNGGFGYFSYGDFIGFSNHNHLEEILKGNVIGNTTDNPELNERIQCL